MNSVSFPIESLIWNPPIGFPQSEALWDKGGTARKAIACVSKLSKMGVFRRSGGGSA